MDPTEESAAPSSGINFNDFTASNEGLQQLDIWRVIANILLYVGYGGAFLAFLIGIILWVIGHKFGGRHVLDDGKTTILRAMGGGLLLGSAGAIWTWLVAQ